MHYVVLFSAKKHGIHTLDMVHAINNALRSLPNKESKLIIGPNRAGNLIEVGARFSEDSVLIYHAMKVQSRHMWRQS